MTSDQAEAMKAAGFELDSVVFMKGSQERGWRREVQCKDRSKEAFRGEEAKVSFVSAGKPCCENFRRRHPHSALEIGCRMNF